MNLRFLLATLALLLGSVVADPPRPHDDVDYTTPTDIFYWPVGAPQPSVLARVLYGPSSLFSDLLSYHPPSIPQDGLVRIGFYTSTPSNPKQWTGGLVSGALLTGKHQPTLHLHLDTRGELYHVSLAAPSTTTSEANTASLPVELVVRPNGPRPQLNEPIALRPDGEREEEVVEKTFLQKYWWVLLIVMFMTMSGGGGE
ncbi:hypothetical protein N7492_003964 [Penicillium capsulatum]|uniref:Uncharacterized protein n=1 Tax=Penicillium capsulatum TaxID=69766 RepID=A0A9W9IMV1_9EURO|nr:hypothetical protein N7492_003964 [Penicillium capsulatum]KAJ6121458.1 hypothetical protein N7512_003923 [Penicillium capsulatum]